MGDNVRIEISGVGKKYKRWIFRNVDLSLDPTIRYGVIGRNGIGKSTLLKIISGYTTPSAGRVSFLMNDNEVQEQQAALMVGFAAPYIDVIKELTVTEMVRFHGRFHNRRKGVGSIDEFLQIIQLTTHADVLAGDLSSGLMQRLKVGLVLLSETPIILLDEPTSYLDLSGKRWFYNLLEEFAGGRLVMIASNDPEDLETCQQLIDIELLAVPT